MIPALILLVLAVIYRVVTGLYIQSGTTWLSNFAPCAALVLCAAAFFPAWGKFSIPLVALFLSDVALNSYYGASILDPLIMGRYLALICVGLIGWSLRNNASFKTMLPASVAGSTLFYLITNTFSWLSDPGYVKSLAGLIQAQTVGLAQYSGTPTWTFYRNSLFSDLLFTALFIACMSWNRGRSATPAPVPRTA